ncbi:MAG TPA: hypothetical protein VIM09_06100 [Chthoniobacterales bacterium]|jgi:hypothetical protein
MTAAAPNDLLIVVPTFNESANIPELIAGKFTAARSTFSGCVSRAARS